MDPTCRLETLGCKVNQYDTQLVREALSGAGFKETGRGVPADLCIVNTCTVTHQADAQGRQLIRKMARENPRAKIVVMGCYAAREPETLRGLPGVVGVVETPGEVFQLLGQYGIEALPKSISKFDGHHRAFVKVQDGCILNCTFCIIPKVRPDLVSRPIEQIEFEVWRLVEAGYQEIVLTGIHLGHYGIEFSRHRPRNQWCRLPQLVERLLAIPGDWRLRLSSLDAAEVSDSLVELIAGQKRIVPHLHICLQSGSDEILRAMKRRYSVKGFIRRVERIRAALSQPAITTDVIVGFPGESANDFESTLAVCRDAEFSKIHAFPFSARAGTPAAGMSAQVSPEEIRERKTRLSRLANELATRYHRSLVGEELEVLLEKWLDQDSKLASGTCCRYVPTRVQADRGELGKLVKVRIRSSCYPDLIGDRKLDQENLTLPVIQNVQE